MKKIQPFEEQLKSMVKFAKSVDLEEVFWEEGGRRVAFKRRRNGQNHTVKEGSDQNEPVATLHTITSPIVGTFWRAPSKTRPPLVVEGDEITAGQRVAFVEAMKVQKDVISNVSGRIRNILLENGRPAEYGQPLMEVEVSEK